MKSVSTLTTLVVRPGENIPRASSLQIAEAFDKNHKNVLAKIKELVNECPTEFGRLNFQPSDYLNAQGKTQPLFFLTQDAFVLLAMGFSGPKALMWKIHFIHAFNVLAEQRRCRALPETADGAALIRRGLALARRLTPSRRRLIRRAANYAALGLSHQEIGRLLRCGWKKARLLLQEQAWIAGPAEARLKEAGQ